MFNFSRLGRDPATAGQFSKSFVGSIIVIALLALIGFSILPTIRLAGQADSRLDLGTDQLIRFSADLFAFVVPSPFHPVWGGVMRGVFTSSFTGNEPEAIQYLGVVPLLLLIFFWRHIPSAPRRFWLTGGVLFGLIALGPRLHVFGHVLGIPLPYALLAHVPVLSSVRTVGRAGVMVGVCMAVLLAYLLMHQVRRVGSALVLTAVILADFLFAPVTVQSTQLSGVYGAVQSVGGSQILEIPAATNYAAASKSLFASHIHGKEIFGNIALERAQDPAILQLSRSVPAVRQLLFLRTTDLRERRADFFDQDLGETLPDALQWLNIQAIVVDTDSVSTFQAATLDRFLSEADMTRQDFGDAVLYTPSAGFGTASDGIFVMRDAGFEHVAYDEERGHVFAEISHAATLSIVNTHSVKQTVSLRFQLAPESKGTASISLSGRVLRTIAPDDTEVAISLEVPPGVEQIAFDTQGSDSVIMQDPHLELIR